MKTVKADKRGRTDARTVARRWGHEFGSECMRVKSWFKRTRGTKSVPSAENRRYFPDENDGSEE